MDGTAVCSLVSDALSGSEENVYRLCQTLIDRGHARADSSDLMVVFISNENRQVGWQHVTTSGMLCCIIKSEGVIATQIEFAGPLVQAESRLLCLSACLLACPPARPPILVPACLPPCLTPFQVPLWRQQASGDAHEAWSRADCPQCRGMCGGEARRDEASDGEGGGRGCPAHDGAEGTREANGSLSPCSCRGKEERVGWGNEERVRRGRDDGKGEGGGCRSSSEGRSGSTDACSPRDDGRGLVVWDYHVIALQGDFPHPSSSSSSPSSVGCSVHAPLSACRPCDVRVWDLDATLPFPARLCCYARHALWAGKEGVPPLLPTYQR